MNDSDKELAGRAAADLVEDGMRVGLGTGSTSRYAILRLAERVAGGLRMVGVATSLGSEAIAREAGVPLGDFEANPGLDLAIDGADEVDRNHHLTKGGGGALLREKVVAAAATRFIVVVDESKLVEQLGVTFRLPVEIVPFARRPIEHAITSLGGDVCLRQRSNQPVVTDNGNWLLDVHFPDGISDPAETESALDRIPGVVESGLFVGLATQIVIGSATGVEIRDVKRRARDQP